MSLKQINYVGLNAFNDRVKSTPWLPTNEPEVNNYRL